MRDEIRGNEPAQRASYVKIVREAHTTPRTLYLVPRTFSREDLT